MRDPQDQPTSQHRPGTAQQERHGRDPVGARRATVSLLLTCSEPGRPIGPVLAQLPSCVDEVVVVDTGGDRLAALPAGTGPDLRVVVAERPGRGHALRAGLEAASGDLIVAMESDGRMSPSEIPQLVYFLERGFDLVRGSRFVAGGGTLDRSAMRRAGNRLLLSLANRWFEVGLTDLCYGFFAVRRHFLDHLELTSTGGEIEVELAVRAALAGLRIAELPSREHARPGWATWAQFVDDHVRVLRTLQSLRRSRPGALHAAGPAAR